jgi:hypothetical protein
MDEETPNAELVPQKSREYKWTTIHGWWRYYGGLSCLPAVGGTTIKIDQLAIRVRPFIYPNGPTCGGIQSI